MFLVEGSAGLFAHSTALLADSLDMLGDAFVYGFSLYVIARGPRWQIKAALLKGTIMALFGISVLGEAVLKAISGRVPAFKMMTGIGFLALSANVICALFLLRHRNADINMRSTWLCSRNDVIANLAVLLAAGAVALTDSRWPDIAVGILVACIILKSAFSVLQSAVGEWRTAKSGKTS